MPAPEPHARETIDRYFVGERCRKLVGVLYGASATLSVSRRAEPANQYPYVSAVADGVNAGYDIYRIRTEVSEKGTTVKTDHDCQKCDRHTPDAGSKTRFVHVDVIGVTESDKTDSRPLERTPTVAYDQLLKNVACDEVPETGYNGRKTKRLVASWKQFIERNQGEITAQRIHGVRFNINHQMQIADLEPHKKLPK